MRLAAGEFIEVMRLTAGCSVAVIAAALGLALTLPQARAAGEIGQASKVLVGANVAQGEMHYNQLKCAARHAERMMGSSTAMFTRPDRKVRSAAELLGFTQMCVSWLNHSLFPDEVRDIAAYLNEVYYHFN